MAQKKVTLSCLADHVAGRLEGPGHIQVAGIAELHLAGPAELSFLISTDHLKDAQNTKAAAVLISDSLEPVSLPMVWVPNVPKAINMALDLFTPPPKPCLGVHPSAIVDPTAVLATDVSIGPNVVVEAGTSIGDDDAFAMRTSLRLTIKLGPDSLFEEPLK